MKKLPGLYTFFLLLLLMLAEVPTCNSQDGPLLRLKRFQDVSQVSWKHEIYYLPAFQKSKIIYRTGFRLNQTLDINYNIYYERMDFVNASGDTSGIHATNDIAVVEVGDHTFYHDYKSGYYEVLVTSTVSLAVKPRFSLVNTEGSCGPVSQSLETRGAVMDCDRLYLKNLSYYFIDLNNRIWKADRTSVFKLFPEHKVAIREFLDKNTTDWTQRQDLIRLLEYCNNQTANK